jgi:transcriptional regulator with XRE-family HTH domain
MNKRGDGSLRNVKLKKKRPALQPGLAHRITLVLEESGKPKEEQVPHLCERTGLSKQSVYRWLSANRPGNPDLESFATLCDEFNVDANWLLGLMQTRLPLRVSKGKQRGALAEAGEPSFLQDIAKEIGVLSPACESRRMQGDEMEPRIKDGALLLVDTSVKQVAGNGVYVIEDKAGRIVRTVERRVGQGLAVICDNPKYREVLIPDRAKRSVVVYGRVRFWMHLNAA